VDYAAPKGTPVYAAGDGKVIASGYNKYNGNYVFIQHGQTYTTKYIHLHKRKVRKGQTVRQRQVIGSVGSTGYSTGNHLHYEFLVNGVHRNPRTVKLPQAKPISASERQDFDIAVKPMLAELARQQEKTQLAFLDEN
jgi:murein DD-endopeptidase MepM/ murein hydrolase activator NlpD